VADRLRSDELTAADEARIGAPREERVTLRAEQANGPPKRRDLTDGHGDVSAPALPAASGEGRPPRWTKWAYIDGIRCRVRTGAPWWGMPAEPHPAYRCTDGVAVVSLMGTGRGPVCAVGPPMRWEDQLGCKRGTSDQPWRISHAAGARVMVACEGNPGWVASRGRRSRPDCSRGRVDHQDASGARSSVIRGSPPETTASVQRSFRLSVAAIELLDAPPRPLAG